MGCPRRPSEGVWGTTWGRKSPRMVTNKIPVSAMGGRTNYSSNAIANYNNSTRPMNIAHARPLPSTWFMQRPTSLEKELWQPRRNELSYKNTNKNSVLFPGCGSGRALLPLDSLGMSIAALALQLRFPSMGTYVGAELAQTIGDCLFL